MEPPSRSVDGDICADRRSGLIVARSGIIVLGMHRSGTSCLAGTLEQAGLYLGEVNREALFNAKGNRENREIMDLNDVILSENGASWDNPPKSPPIWRRAHYKERDRILASYPDDRVIGFKDPRTLFTLGGWREALPGARLVATFRHPMAVAQSLSTRDRFSLERGLDLWFLYNRKLLDLSTTDDVRLINFDWPPDLYGNVLRALCSELDLLPLTERLDFFETDLRHHTPSQGLPQGPYMVVYRMLVSLAANQNSC